MAIPGSRFLGRATRARTVDPWRDQLIKRIRAAVEGLDVAPDILDHLLRQADPDPGRHEIAKAVTATSVDSVAFDSISNHQLIEMAMTLEATTGLNVYDERGVFGWRKVVSVGSQVVGGVLFVVCTYLTLGGLLSQPNRLLSGHLASLFVFAFLMTVLCVYESLHISVTQLKMADLRALESDYPRAAAIHKKFATSHKIERSLAGRHLVVILTVFLIAQLTSHTGQVFPWTSVVLPSWLMTAERLGIPGALMVLWLAQLMSQFLATRRSVGIMNQRVIGWAFQVALGLEAIGLARPGSWLAAWDTTKESIPTSREMLWDQATFVTDGFGAIGKTYDVEIGSDGTLIVITSIYLIGVDGLESIPVRDYRGWNTYQAAHKVHHCASSST